MSAANLAIDRAISTKAQTAAGMQSRLAQEQSPANEIRFQS